ncbi:ABC transporter permease [Methylobacterium planeticum]|uniref:ABC transporter permease n=1 Tax=Methylobacterium planeticum TaxID=2615211 RepID=A0A6N6MJG1_9HYPH|nr:ABC transporter permease [Methylobacterium planeticum]KAB1069209.1 ABC transporter permease [Methylobacterium planeticum]
MLTVIGLAHRLRIPIAVAVALLAGASLIALSGVNPFEAYTTLFRGAFLDWYGLGGTLVKTSPLLLAGLAVVIPLRAGLLNIGGEGQIYMGGLGASVAALYLPGLPTLLHIVLCVLAGALAGGLWGLIPAYLKAYRGINEVITAILLNFIAINLVSYLAGGPMMQAGAPYPYSNEISEALWLPLILSGTDAHVGVIIGAVLALVAYYVLNHTTVGFALDTVGAGDAVARYAGIAVRRQLLGAMFVGSACAGLAGSFEVLGLKYRLYHLFSPGFGFDGILVAFLAALNPLLVPVSAFFLSGLKAGALTMQRATGLDGTVIDAIQGIVILFVATSLAFTFRREEWRRFLDKRKLHLAEPPVARAKAEESAR